MTNDLVERLRANASWGYDIAADAANFIDELEQQIAGLASVVQELIDEDKSKRIEILEAALLDIFDHECRINSKSLIACTARDALWPPKGDE
jgi:hypothetical protein